MPKVGVKVYRLWVVEIVQIVETVESVETVKSVRSDHKSWLTAQRGETS